MTGLDEKWPSLTWILWNVLRVCRSQSLSGLLANSKYVVCVFCIS